MEHTGSPSRLSIALGLLLVLLLAAAIGLKLCGERSANAPSGIAGAKFGWSEQSLESSVPGLAPVPGAQKPAFPRFRARVLVFDEPASCDYELAAAGTLSRVDCVFDAATSSSEHAQKAEKLVLTLRHLYGAESKSRPGYVEWKNREARLGLSTNEPSSTPLPLIRLTNTSKAHDAALAALQRAAPAR